VPRADRDGEEPAGHADVVFSRRPSCVFHLVPTGQSNDGHTIARLVHEGSRCDEKSGVAHAGEERDVVSKAGIVEQRPGSGRLRAGASNKAAPHSPVEGSITLETFDIRFAGKPPRRACSSMMAAPGAT